MPYNEWKVNHAAAKLLQGKARKELPPSCGVTFSYQLNILMINEIPATIVAIFISFIIMATAMMIKMNNGMVCVGGCCCMVFAG